MEGREKEIKHKGLLGQCFLSSHSKAQLCLGFKHPAVHGQGAGTPQG